MGMGLQVLSTGLPQEELPRISREELDHPFLLGLYCAPKEHFISAFCLVSEAADQEDGETWTQGQTP